MVIFVFVGLMDTHAQLSHDASQISVENSQLKEDIERVVLERDHIRGLCEEEKQVVLSRKELQSERMRDRITELELSLTEKQDIVSKVTESKDDMINLVMDYTMDRRSHHDTILEWLNDVAAQRGARLSTIRQEEGGVLACAGSSNKGLGINY